MPTSQSTLPRRRWLGAAAAATASLPALFTRARAATETATAAPADGAPPRAPVDDVVERLHGQDVHDPYRWMEDVQNPRTRSWLQAQGRYAEQRLAALPERDELAARIAELQSAGGTALRDVLRMPGGRIYYLQRKPGASQFNLVLRQGERGRERLLVDAVRLSQAGGQPHAINWFAPSWDGRWLAYGVSAGGSEEAALHLLEVASGRQRVEPIPRVLTGDCTGWAPDSSAFAYNQLRAPAAGEAEADYYKDSAVYLLRVRQPAAAPRLLFSRLALPSLALDRLDVASLQFAPGSPYVVARTTDTTVPQGGLYVAPVAAVLGEAGVPWQQLSAFADQITDAQLRGDTLYLRSTAGAPRGQVLAVNLARPRLAEARTVVAEPPQGVLEGFTLGRRALYIELREGFRTRLLRSTDAGPAAGPGVDVAPGLQGSAYAVPDPAHAYGDVWFNTSTWTEPRRLLQSTASGHWRDTGLRQNRLPPRMPATEVKEVIVPSHDGAPVPMALLHKAGLTRDGRNPTLLVGYGAYGFSMEARFDPALAAWIERGGVLALANVRGSGAYGEAWHRAGFKLSKPNTWKDGIACARWLIQQGYASPATLSIWGTSAGGIFVGRAVTEAPQLFAAAIFDVGTLDAVRFEHSANGATNVSEFGTVADADEFRALLAMSTYHQIKDGTAYPAVLLVHGLNDPRVDVWHSAKTAARLQAASSSGKPVWLRIDEQAGHGIGSSFQQDVLERADIYAFLLAQIAVASRTAQTRSTP